MAPPSEPVGFHRYRYRVHAPTPTAVFYHGTRASFRGSGQIVLPGPTIGRSNWPSIDNDPGVYITTNLDQAWLWAQHARGRGHPKVLIVNPGGWVRPDTTGTDSYRCEYALVERVLTTSTAAAP